jgi:hypothetical protein
VENLINFKIGRFQRLLGFGRLYDLFDPKLGNKIVQKPKYPDTAGILS